MVETIESEDNKWEMILLKKKKRKHKSLIRFILMLRFRSDWKREKKSLKCSRNDSRRLKQIVISEHWRIINLEYRREQMEKNTSIFIPRLEINNQTNSFNKMKRIDRKSNNNNNNNL